MTEDAQTTTGNAFLAVVTGIAATFLAGLILYPIENFIFRQFFEFDAYRSPTIITTNELILHLSILAWFSIAAFTGGLACARVSKKNEYRHTWILVALVLIFSLYMSFGESSTQREQWFLVITLLASTASFLWGARTSIRIKNKSRLRKDMVDDLLRDEKDN